MVLLICHMGRRDYNEEEGKVSLLVDSLLTSVVRIQFRYLQSDLVGITNG